MPQAASRFESFASDRVTPEGVHAIHPNHGFNVVLLRGAASDQYLAAVIPFDDFTLDRLDATRRFYLMHEGRPPPRDTRMTAEQRRRFRLKIRAADGHMNGASYREIAIAFYGDARVEAEYWKTSPLRDSVIGFVEAGLALINGGYLQLLRHRRRTPRDD